MELFYKIVANNNIIDEIMIDSSGNVVHKSELCIRNDITKGNDPKVKAKFRIKRKTCLDGYCCSAFAYLLQWSQIYKYYVRNYLINKFSIPDSTNGYILIKIESINPKKEIIDYKWNYRIIHLCKERYELEKAMSWLSTLGGGYSCLGDYIEHYSSTMLPETRESMTYLYTVPKEQHHFKVNNWKIEITNRIIAEILNETSSLTLIKVSRNDDVKEFLNPAEKYYIFKLKSITAVIAGKISAQQFKIALKLGDPLTVSRCRLYYSISLMQQGYLREARAIIQNEYNKITAGLIKDDRLKRMCHGIWAKLKFEWALKYKSRKLSNVHNSVI